MDSSVLALCLLLSTLPVLLCTEHHLASKLKAEEIERRRCGYYLTILWTAELAHAPFASTPLIADINADGKLDIVAAPFSENFHVLDAETGKSVPNSRWPALNLESSIHSSPLQYDIDGDGMLDLLFAMSSGDLLFYNAEGTMMLQYKFQLPHVYVLKEWYKEMITVPYKDISNYVSLDPAKAQDNKYIAVDPHIFATPVIADLNNDHIVDELVVSVTYLFEEDDYRFPQQLEQIGVSNFTDLEKYLVAGVVVVNLTTMEINWMKVLDLTQVTSEFPGYNLFTPTVIDLDSAAGPLEIVVGTSASNVYVFDHLGNTRPGWPQLINSIHGQITAGDITGTGKMSLVMVDTSGIVYCRDPDGKSIWETEISGTSSPGSRLFDVDKDGILDVIITTNDGNVYALGGKTGAVLSGWPVKTDSKILSNVLVTSISSMHSTPDMVFITEDGYLQIMSADLKCNTHLQIGESSLVSILSHDLVSQSEGLELLVATNDGTLICIGSENERDETEDNYIDEDKLKRTHQLSLPSETKHFNDFSFAINKPSVYVQWHSKSTREVTGGHFNVRFEIIDPSYEHKSAIKNIYNIQIYFGRNLLYHKTYDAPNEYEADLQVWEEPTQGHVIVVLSNQHGQIFQDVYPLRFNLLVMEDLQWLLLAPFVAMAIILLVIHGFPSKDLLPYTNQAKAS